MSDNYTNLTALQRFKEKLMALIGAKQDTLVSGTNIKTINNESLLGSGNIETDNGVFHAYSSGEHVTSFNDLITAIDSNKIIIVDDRYVCTDVHHTNVFAVLSTVLEYDDEFFVRQYYLYDRNVWNHIDHRLQDVLVSGTNIKTVNNQSILGSGNINIQGGGGDILIASVLDTTYAEIKGAYDNKKIVIMNDVYIVPQVLDESGDESKFTLCGYYPGGNSTVTYTIDNQGVWTIVESHLLPYEENIYSKIQTDALLSDKLDADAVATDSDYGIVKLNPNQNITLNANGQLEVGGRIGQFTGTTGLFAPNNRAPRNVLDYSLLITDALGMDMSANRSIADVSGYGLTCKSAAAGTTTYRISNTYANRIFAKLCENGYASRDEATSKVEQIVPVVSVKIGSASYTPDSSANDASNDIVITTASTLNPDSAITSIRLFGKMQSYASLHVGNGVRSDSGGRSLVLGGGVMKTGSTNDNCIVGMGIYSGGNGVACFGRYHIARKNRGLLAGTGHDTTNARSEGASALGEYSYMDSNTMFAVGNGTSQTERSNAFEVTADGGIVLKSPNGTRYKITVDNNGNFVPSAL